MTSIVFAGLAFVSAVSALDSDSDLLWARNNPPQPPCVYPYTKFVYSGCFHDDPYQRSLPFEAVEGWDWGNATIEKCTAYCKGNNYRYAGLEYFGQCFCGASVTASTAAEEDCRYPCNGDNTQACGGANRLSVYQDPTFPDADAIGVSSDYMSLGCYTEGISGRSLDYSQYDFLDKDNMTTTTCLDMCGSKGFPFAGLEFGEECYCGVVLGNGTLSVDPSNCPIPCSGNSTETCGGHLHLNLYVAKSLGSAEPCAPPIISSVPPSSEPATSTPLSSSPTSSDPPVSDTTSEPPVSTPEPPVSTLSSEPPVSTPSSEPSVSTPSSEPPSSSTTTTSKCWGWKCHTPTTTSYETPTPTKRTSTKKTTSSKKTSTKKSSTKRTTSTKKTTSKISSTKTRKSTSSRPSSTTKKHWDW